MPECIVAALQTDSELSIKLATMPPKNKPISQEDRERIAAQLVASSEGTMSVPDAMKQANLETPIRKNDTVRKRVYRNSKKLVEQFNKSGSFFVPPPVKVVGKEQHLALGLTHPTSREHK